MRKIFKDHLFLQDPSKAAIKKHHSLVLRCESASEKYAWLARLKYVSESTGVDRPVRKYTSAQIQSEGSKNNDKDSRRGDKGDRPPKVSLLFLPFTFKLLCICFRSNYSNASIRHPLDFKWTTLNSNSTWTTHYQNSMIQSSPVHDDMQLS